MKTSTLHFSTPDDSEELARAEVYGLLAGLFNAPPSAGLYESLKVAVTEAPAPGGFLEANWSALVAASRRLTLGEVADEYVTSSRASASPRSFCTARTSWPAT